MPSSLTFLEPGDRNGQRDPVDQRILPRGELDPRSRSRRARRDDGPGRRFNEESKDRGRCIARQHNDVGGDVGLVELERNADLRAGRYPTVRVEDDVDVRHTGKDLEEVLLQDEVVVGIERTGHQHVTAGAVGERRQRGRINLLGRAEADTEHAIIYDAGDVGNELRRVFTSVCQDTIAVSS